MLDIREAIEPARALDADVCIVGAGPAGLAVASRLEGTGLRVLVLESGGLHPAASTERLNRGQVRGTIDIALHASRLRGLGGTANRWGGWCRPLDPCDLERRHWVADSGWPISHDEIATWHPATSDFLGLPPDPFAGQVEGASEALATVGLEPANFAFSPLAHTMRAHAEQLRLRWRDVITLLNVTVVDIRTDGPDLASLFHLEVLRGDGERFTVRARAVVLAVGAVEAARILLAMRRDRPAGLGNENGLVGRYFMDHLHAQTGFLLTTDPHLRSPYFADFATFASESGSGALSATGSAQREAELLALSMTLTPAPHHFDPWPRGAPAPLDTIHQRARSRADLAPADLTLLGGTATRAVSLSSKAYLRALRTARAGADRARFAPTGIRLRRRASRLGEPAAVPLAMFVRSEQVPDAASRVLLSRQRDELGMPRAVLDWRPREQDYASVEAWMARFGDAVQRGGLGHVVLDPRWRAKVHGGPHHLGTTRMSHDPRNGVVDPDCQLHSVPNLYVAGSAVFPTGGFANPTFELVAISMRLGHHLATTLGARPSAPPQATGSAQLPS